jgi:dCMP deaminase
VAHATSLRATCLRRRVGCILLDDKKRILATGYNGPPRGLNNCTHSCPGQAVDGVDSCMAIHAEINALMQCHRTDDVYAVVCTCFPCFRCLKALLNTGVKELYFRDTYPDYEQYLWMLEDAGVAYEQLEINNEELF